MPLLRDTAHQREKTAKFVTQYDYFERHDDASVAARRERAAKRWRRDWKIELIEKCNPTWRDLFADVLRDDGFEW